MLSSSGVEMKTMVQAKDIQDLYMDVKARVSQTWTNSQKWQNVSGSMANPNLRCGHGHSGHTRFDVHGQMVYIAHSLLPFEILC